jgi:hypothetical protein
MFNTDIMTNFSMQAAVIIPIITAVVQALKFWVNEKYSPFVSMLVGIGITFLFTHDALRDLSGTILLGLLFGLAASGLYSGLVTTKAAIKERKAEQQARKENRNK